ncbi:hypothetical protein EDC04DRAFT_2577895, partial [Pisolithus marmoratus]
LILGVAHTMWFANKHDKGIMYLEHFKPFPYLTLALEMEIKCCIDEWATGKQGDISFTMQEYHSVYGSYVKCLQDFNSTTKAIGILPMICSRIYKVSQYVLSTCTLDALVLNCLSVHSGASTLTMEPQCKVSVHVIAATIQEHEDGMTTGDKSD